MSDLLHQLIRKQAEACPDTVAVLHKDVSLDYAALESLVTRTAGGLAGLGLAAGARVAIYLPKTMECVAAMFGALAAGGVFVPVNPILKAAQVGYILRDCNVQILVTSRDRLGTLRDELRQCTDLLHVVLTDDRTADNDYPVPTTAWCTLLDDIPAAAEHRRIDADIAAILYTSGSTGKPKGVVLTHRNMVAGAASVAEYLRNTSDDCLLAVLPFSFDYGFSQLSTTFLVGASVVLMDYLLPRDVVRALARYRITGLAAVPPLWNQLAALPWPEEIATHLRYITNSGGAMPLATTNRLRELLPDTDVYLMYGLTEAFRSTFLDPLLVAERPESMGKAIPNAEVLVVRPDGSECDPNEPGELVHRGALVALGYWNDPEKTAERFRPAPGQPAELPNPEIAVWSGDQVRRDADGYLYFESRKDEMIKTSGYRVSPTEVEEVVFSYPGIAQVAALGIGHPVLGQAIVLALQPAAGDFDQGGLLTHLKQALPAYMVPTGIEVRNELPRNANGKLDRKALLLEYADYFANDDG